ncbi:hypothetical protein IEQ34_015488 [Dendrobium chrysotoxum]|nr:hypothetical protein IEQ34_015488 [Dendrobium chrysotoxum]
MNVASYSSFQPGGPSDTKNIEVPNIGYSSEDIERLRIQYIGEGKVKMRLYEGRVVKDMMVANELNCHASLQEDSKIVYENIQILSPDPSSPTLDSTRAIRCRLSNRQTIHSRC